MLAPSPGLDKPGKWLIDSGASSHFSPFRPLFLNLSPCIPPLHILTGSGFLTAEWHGPIPLLIKGHNDAVVQLILQNVLYVPQLQSRVNLFSVVVLADKNIHSTFGPHDVQFSLDGSLLASGTCIGNSWWLNADVRSHELYHAAHALSMSPRNTTDTLPTWHKRLGHLNNRDIMRLQNLATGLSIGKPPIPSHNGACTGCLVGKQHCDISRMPHTPKRRLARIHIDICGPMQIEGIVGKHLYSAVFVDEATRFTHAYCIVQKSDLRDSVLNYISLVKRETGDSVLALFSDNECALLQKGFQDFLHERGITHYTTQSYSPEMNGIAESANKQIIQKASCLMWEPRIPLGFWPEAVRCAAYLKNRSPNRALNKTPFECWYGLQPNLGHLRIFGCHCYAHVPKDTRQKLDSHTIEGVFLGYYATEHLFAVYDIARRIIVKKRDVVFCEHVLGHPSLSA